VSKIKKVFFFFYFLLNKKYRNVSWASHHHIKMISEGSCDTEDWSNDAFKCY